jgi:hypothetical protein
MQTSAAAIVLAALGAWLAPRPAEACTPKGSGHYYVIQGVTTNAATHGASIDLATQALDDATPSSSFVDHEFWYGVTGDGRYWVEAGVTDGVTFTGSQVNHAIFWADNRGNGGGYHEHYPRVSWRLGLGYYRTQIQWAGNNAWDVYFGGVHLGQSTHNFYGGTARFLSSGIEAVTAHTGDHVQGYMATPRRKDSANAWHVGWGTVWTEEDCPGDLRRTNSVTFHEVLHGNA